MGYWNKFDSMKSLGVCYWYVKIPQCTYLKHGLEYITFYVQNIWHLWQSVLVAPLVHEKPLGAPTFVRLSYYPSSSSRDGVRINKCSHSWNGRSGDGRTTFERRCGGMRSPRGQSRSAGQTRHGQGNHIGFSNMASDGLAVVLPAYQMPEMKIFVN